MLSHPKSLFSLRRVLETSRMGSISIHSIPMIKMECLSDGRSNKVRPQDWQVGANEPEQLWILPWLNAITTSQRRVWATTPWMSPSSIPSTLWETTPWMSPLRVTIRRMRNRITNLPSTLRVTPRMMTNQTSSLITRDMEPTIPLTCPALPGREWMAAASEEAIIGGVGEAVAADETRRVGEASCWECNYGMGIAIENRQKVVLSINGNSVPCGWERICCTLY